MERKALKKDFDEPDTQRAREPSLAEMWSEEAYALYGPPHDTAVDVGRYFEAKGIAPVLDVGCGPGPLRAGYSGRWVGLDRSIEQLRQTEGSRVIGDALTLPFADESFEGVAANYVLYFFEQPELVALEALRVLRPSGLFATCAPSRYDCPELAHVAPTDEEGTFAAEDIPALLFEHFRDVEVTVWDFPAFDLRDRQIVADYLYSHYYPQLTHDEATRRADLVDVPLKLTKRGIWGVGRKPR